MILSLSVQVLLGTTAPLRKKSTNRFLVFAIWSAYFTADWAATFTFGLITNAQLRDLNDPKKVDDIHLAFWAAFLLFHLGVPDTITAYSREDNALWERHLAGLIAQPFTFIYIFLNTLPDNNLWVAAILIAVAGTIKYGEGPGHCIFVVIMPNHAERSKSLEIILSKEARGTYDIIETELDLLYDLFYTKMLATDSRWGKLSRIGMDYTLFAALVLYFLSKKEGCHEVDIRITYVLMAGAIFLETLSIFMMEFSKLSNLKRMIGRLDRVCAGSLFPLFIVPSLAIVLLLSVLEGFRGPRRYLRRYWCKYLGAFNLVCDSYGQCERGDNEVKKFAHAISLHLIPIILLMLA
ncbi:hypothetical protein MLD38_010020 [Melastoma candidum]|uniref:Uncharacterized protein n=1 Tax=Melastoma candidum TaxID=119954 RepID=A0ACB9QYH0_9MYRT|nr:hypothetical protein MLD38_010020 [Melastoma candidum]